MDLGIVKKLFENARKIDWDTYAVLNGQNVTVKDVDLKGKVSLDSPLNASVTYVTYGINADKEIKGTFWPKDLKEEAVYLDGVKQMNGKVSLAGSYKFPLSCKVKLRFRWEENGEQKEFLVKGDIGAGSIF